ERPVVSQLADKPALRGFVPDHNRIAAGRRRAQAAEAGPYLVHQNWSQCLRSRDLVVNRVRQVYGFDELGAAHRSVRVGRLQSGGVEPPDRPEESSSLAVVSL